MAIAEIVVGAFVVGGFILLCWVLGSLVTDAVDRYEHSPRSPLPVRMCVGVLVIAAGSLVLLTCRNLGRLVLLFFS